MLWRRWLKWLIVDDTKRQVLLAQEACSGPYNGSAMLRPLTEAARKVAPLGVVLADAEFDSEYNHRHVHERLGAVSVIPAKRGKATWQLQGYRAQMRVAFPSQLYRRRALVESVFSAVKRKDRKSTRLNSSHANISYAVFCLKKKKYALLCLPLTK